MIEFECVSKSYGTIKALQDVSFRADENRIIGLLGRNGAGKSTMLNILTGYLPPSSGKVIIDGRDMLDSPLECKSRIGYLPEKPPLYDEMTVYEYLSFASELRKPKHKVKRERILEIMTRCGVEEQEKRVIGTLSKGFRQRVGIAQALCGAPELLVLDEPTAGLDPQQVAEIRDLIRTLGKTHTILFSSHILSEVQQLCNRILILHNGKLIRDCEPDSMTADYREPRISLTVKGEGGHLINRLKSLDQVRRVKITGKGNGEKTTFEITCGEETEPGSNSIAIFRLLSAMDAPVLAMTPVQDSLEAFFIRETSE